MIPDKLAGLAASLSCQLTDPGCYIDDFAHKQLYQFDLSIWQINRAGLVLARWLEDLRVWLTDAVLADAFATLTQPVKFLFSLALVVAWLVFVISFMVQSFIDLRWVDLRRATRPILLALFLFSAGGSVLKGTEYARLLGGTLLQQAAREAVQAFQAPPVPTENTGDMADASASIYSSASSCGTPARTQAAMFLNDYDARYLWASADDIHCAEIKALAGEFYSTYFPYGQDISGQAGDTRQLAVSAATLGGTRQVTGVFMTGGALIEQSVQLLFAVALALVWFGILLSLVFAVFVPAETLLSGQLRTLLSVLRASWLASFLLGLGLAVLQIVAESGNGSLVFISGMALIAVAIWQGKQALQTMGAALSALSAATGSAPQAVGGMLKSWATTAALVAGVAATGGGLGAALGSVGSAMARRAGRSAGDNLLSKAAGRVLSNRVADRLDAYTQDQRLEQEADLSAAEAAWYERDEYAGAGTPAADADARLRAAAADQRSHELQARILDRRAERARQTWNFPKASQLRRAAAKLRADRAPEPAPEELETWPIEIDLALEQLYEASDDPEQQRRVLASTIALALRRAQPNDRHEQRPAGANDSNADPLDENLDASGQPLRERPAMRANPILPAADELGREPAALARQIAGLNQASSTLGEPERDGAAARLSELHRRLLEAPEFPSALQPQPEIFAHHAGRPAPATSAAAGPPINEGDMTNERPLPDRSAVQTEFASPLTPAAGNDAQLFRSSQAQRSPSEQPASAADREPTSPGPAAQAQPTSTITPAAAEPPQPAISQAARAAGPSQALQAQRPQRPAGVSSGQPPQPGAIPVHVSSEVAPARSAALPATEPALAPVPAAAQVRSGAAEAAASPVAPKTSASVRPAQAEAERLPLPAAAARRHAVQPASAMAGLALPSVPEAQERKALAIPAAHSETVAAQPVPQGRATAAQARQPWKRGKQGES